MNRLLFPSTVGKRILRFRFGGLGSGFRTTTVYALAISPLILPSPSELLHRRKELLENKEISCSVHSYHEPVSVQIEHIKEEVRPKSLVQCIVLAIRKMGSAVRLFLRSIQVVIILSPLVLTSWFLCFPSLRSKWYWLFVRCLEMGGSSFIKLGQWAATRPDILPLDLCRELSMLHSTTSCLPFSVMREVIDKELGRPLEDVFEYIEETPVGSGCIAQVYKGRLYGSDVDVAIKVKRPEVDQVFTQDLRLMNAIAGILSYLPFMEYIDPCNAAGLFTRQMYQQLDFRGEAVNLVHFRENFRDDDQFTFPNPYLNLTTSSLLVESFENGVPISSYLSHSTPINSDLANLGLLGILHMLLVDNFLHADLHPGNILVRESVPCKIPLTQSICHRALKNKKNHPQLVFLDTGLVNVLEENQKQNFIDLFMAIANGDGYTAAKLMIERAPQPSPPAIDPEGYIREIGELVNNNMDDGVFNFANLKISNALTTMMTASLSHHVTIDTRFINLFVAIMIMEGMGRQLDPEMNIIRSALPILQYSVPTELKDAAVTAIRQSKLVRKSIYVNVMEYWAHIQRKSSAKSQNENLTEAKVEKQMLEQPLSDKPTVMDLYRSDNN